MARAEDYERYAEHCLKMAGMADNRQDRIIQREIASEWLTVILRVFQKGSQEKIDKIGR